MNFDMSPYGAYIWPAYIVSAVAIIGLTIWSLAAWRRAKAKLAALDPSRGAATQKDKA
jgi:heme exporter protein D